MGNPEAKEILREMIDVENRLQNSYGWDLFPRGVAKAYHVVLDKEDVSQSEIIQLFLRFLDERVNLVISVYREIIENGSKDKKMLEEKVADLETQLRNIVHENSVLSSELKQETEEHVQKLKRRHEKEIEALKDKIKLYEEEKKRTENDLRKIDAGSNVPSAQGGSKTTNSGIKQYAKIIRPNRGPMLPGQKLLSDIQKSIKVFSRRNR